MDASENRFYKEKPNPVERKAIIEALARAYSGAPYPSANSLSRACKAYDAILPLLNR